MRFFFFKQKTAYEMRISDWSSDVCSSDLDMGPDRDERRVEAASCLLRQQILDLMVEDDAGAHLLDPADFLHEVRARQTVGRDAEMHHAAGQRSDRKSTRLNSSH